VSLLRVKARGELGDERDGDGEAEHERPVALRLAEDHLREGSANDGSHHLVRTSTIDAGGLQRGEAQLAFRVRLRRHHHARRQALREP